MVQRMIEENIEALDKELMHQGWSSRKEILETYMKEQNEGKRIVLVDSHAGRCRGYITLNCEPKEGPCKDKKIPEICDFNVFSEFRKQGIGSSLLNEIEREAKLFSKKVGIGVGLNKNYGSAQRLYVKHGYIPDGTGVWYRGEVLLPYADCTNDDDLALYFEKTLKDE